MFNQRSGCESNQFRDNVKDSFYQKVCNRNLKLLRQLDKLNLTNQNLLNENLELIEKVKELNFSLDNLTNDVNDLETNFKALNKPLNNCLENINCSLSVILFLTILFISLFSNLLDLRNKIKEINSNIQGDL